MTLDELKIAIMRLGDDELHTLGLLLEAESGWWQQRDSLIAGLQGIDWPEDDEDDEDEDERIVNLAPDHSETCKRCGKPATYLVTLSLDEHLLNLAEGNWCDGEIVQELQSWYACDECLGRVPYPTVRIDEEKE